MPPNSQLPRVRAPSFEMSNPRAPGPPVLWRKWPTLLERAARARGIRVTTATPRSWAARLVRRMRNADFWSRGSLPLNARASLPVRPGLLGGLERALIAWSHRVEHNPRRMFGMGAAIAFVVGVLVGLL